MKCICKFNPVTDRKEVVAGQSVSVSECLASGTVLPAAKESFYNELDDVSRVGNRVRDTFDALEAVGMIANNPGKETSSKEPNAS